MATTLYQGNTGIMDKDAYALLFDKTFDEIKLQNDKVIKQGMQFVSEKTTDRLTFVSGEVSSELELPPESDDTDDLRLFTPPKGHNKTETPVLRRLGIIVSKTTVETQVFPEIVRMMKGLPQAADRVVEYYIADLFNNGFATNVGADGSYIFASDHTIEDPQYGTWTNTGTAAAFGTAAYFLAWQNLQSRKSAKGYVNPYDPDMVVYAYQIHDKVLEVLGSPKIAENSTNAINPFMGDAKPVKYNYLSSTTAWFVHGKRAGDSQEDEGLRLIWRVRPEYETISDSANPDLVYGKRLRMCVIAGCFHAKNWYGNAGA